jgi:hypothetical protein
MKINLDRLCKLAGVETSGENLLSEASNRSMHEDPTLSGEGDHRFGTGQLSEGGDMDAMHEEDMDAMHEEDMEDMEDMDEMIEIDEVMLVQEIRRAKKMMAEARERKSQQQENLQETQLRKMISEEIADVFKDLNLTSGWVYGSKKPQNRHRGAVNTAFPGVGFKKSK